MEQSSAERMESRAVVAVESILGRNRDRDADKICSCEGRRERYLTFTSYNIDLRAPRTHRIRIAMQRNPSQSKDSTAVCHYTH